MDGASGGGRHWRKEGDECAHGGEVEGGFEIKYGGCFFSDERLGMKDGKCGFC